MSKDLVVASFKIPIQLRDELDAVGKALIVPTRSSLLRLAVEHFLRDYTEGRMPSVYRKNGNGTTEISSTSNSTVYLGEKPIFGNDRKERENDGSQQNVAQRKKSREASE